MRLRSIHIIITIITLLVVVSLLLCSGSLFISEIIPTGTTAITQPSIVELISSQLVKSKFIKLSYPILIPSASGPDAAAVYNPAVVFVNGTFYMFYRAQSKWHGTSVIMLAISYDGIHFEKLNLTVIYPTLKEELIGGCEDPRIVKVNDTYYMTYTAYDGKTARLALARSKDLIHWEKIGIVFPEWSWCKSGAILPVKINGKYIMYFGDSNIWIAYSDDMVHWVTSKD